MMINRKLIKSSKEIKPKEFGFSILITTSKNRMSQLDDCLYYLSKVCHIEKCETVLVIYENEYVDFVNNFNNLNIRVIRSKRNNPENKFCLSHARNIGLIRAKYNWVLSLDGDIIVNDRLYDILFPYINGPENLIYITDRINIPSHYNRSPLDIVKKNTISIDNTFSGFFHLYNRICWINRIGGYDERYIMWGREDCDALMRANISGMKTKKITCPIYHIAHLYEPDWKDDKCDDINHKLQDNNYKNKIIKIDNIGQVL